MTNGRVKEIRHRLGLTQAQLGQLLGVHALTIARWERKSTVDAYHAEMLEAFIKTSHERPTAPAEAKDKLLAGLVLAALGLLIISVMSESKAGS